MATSRRSGRPQWLEDAEPLDMFAAAVAAVLPIAISPVMYSYTFTPKVAVVLVVAAVGLPALIRLGVAGSRTAWAGIAFLLIALISAVTSGSPLVGLFGMYLSGTGWLFWCGVIGAWALGRSLSEAGRILVANGLVLGATVNALVTIAQQALQLRSPVLGLFQGTQADGLMGNPIFLESLLIGALAILLVRCCRDDWRWSGLAALLSASLELSGERFSIVLLAILALWALIVFRSRSALFYVGSLIVGYAIALLVTSALLHHRLTQSVISNPRELLWKTLAHAFIHHPLLGFGPGQTVTPAAQYQSLALARKLTIGILFNDAHDIVIEVAITTGLLGLIAFLAFAGRALRLAEGPLLGFACAALAVELLEPLNVGVTPLIFLALGAAGRGDIHRAVGRTRTERSARLVLCSAAIAASLVVLVGDYELNASSLSFDYPVAARGANLLPIWSGPDELAAEIALNRAAAFPAQRTHWLRIARGWQERAVQHQPTNTEFWQQLASANVSLGANRAALADLQTSLRLDRLNVQALVAIGSLEANLGHDVVAIDDLELAIRVAPGYEPATSELATLKRHRGE